MESKDKNNVNLTNGNGPDLDTNTIYYGVHIPYDAQLEDNDESNVYQDKLEALKLLKKSKKARFKAFNFYHEAVEFAFNGSEPPSTFKSLPTDAPPVKEIQIGEKPPAFRGPKSQDLVKFRKNIEAGLTHVVSVTIWENPRYLISSGDTPSILHEGSRYNALHIAAKSKNSEMCEVILNTVSNVNFIKLLYGDDNHQDANERSDMLLDLYLNTPDKGLNETPLHFAVKFGAVDVVELLVSYPQCDKTLSNKFGHTVNMIICDRCNESQQVKSKIAMLLEDNFYVPVLRSEDTCIPPVIGEPFVPSSPPNFNNDVLSPRMEIHAYAGPMDKQSATKFRRVWKTPPRSLKSTNAPDTAINLKFNDLNKGLERLGKSLSLEFHVGWKEYWSFLGSFVDLSSAEGLQALENYLAERFNNSNVSSTSSSKCTSSENESTTDTVTSPISDLCKNFAACTLSDGVGTICNFKASTSCSAFEHSHDLLMDAQLFKSDLNPFLCIEKSCQVFAHRITNDILHLLESDYSNKSVMLEVQIRQLELLMASFMDDSRFITVNFHLVHHRLGKLIGCKLNDVIVLDDEYNFLKQSLEQWLETFNKQIDNFSSDDESGNYHQMRHLHKKPTSRNQQVLCLLECILSALTSSDNGAVPRLIDEEECMRLWGDAKPCTCVWNLIKPRRNSLVKKSNSFKYTSRGLASPFMKELEDNDTCNKSAEVEEEYYTPPSSPVMADISSDEDLFEDSVLPDCNVFIEGSVPTRTDYAVYNAVKCAESKLNVQDYPNVYKWCHSISLHPEQEQKSWPNPCVAKYKFESPVGTPSTRSTWLRVTGTNSPRSSLKGYPRMSLSFN